MRTHISVVLKVAFGNVNKAVIIPYLNTVVKTLF